MTTTLISGQTSGHVYPVGMVMAWHSATPPVGWLLCNGSNVPIASYQQLYSVLTRDGTRFVYGANIGANFVLPNMTAAFPAQPTYIGPLYNEGTLAGSQTHTHTWDFSGMTISASGTSNHQHIFSQGTDSPAEGGVHSQTSNQAPNTNGAGVNCGANGATAVSFGVHSHNTNNINGNTNGHGGHSHNNNSSPTSGSHDHNFNVTGGTYTPPVTSHLQPLLAAPYIILASPIEESVDA